MRTKLQIGMFRFNVLPLNRIHHPVQLVYMLFYPTFSTGSSASPSLAICRLTNSSPFDSSPFELIIWATPVLWVQRLRVQVEETMEFVSKHDIHDIIALEHAAKQTEDDKARTLWTFRRTDNLRL